MSARIGILTFVAFALGGQLAVAQDAREKPEPIPMSEALKKGADNLTENTGLSEAGQDRAFRIYAAARRIETEHALAEKDVKLVLALEEWREALTNCRADFLSLAYIVEGGGTMYGHAQTRDCAAVEDFLSNLAKRLPLEEKGKGDAKAIKQVDDTMGYVKKLKPFDKETKSEFVEKIKETNQHFEILKGMISEIPGEDARKIAEFSVAPAGWLKGE